MKTVMTLCIVSKDGKLLLGMKKRGFGAGRWNGFGGKVDNDETVLVAANRELTEEVGIVAKEIKKVGVINFTHEEGREGEIEGHIFHVTEFSGEPIETEEMEPDWFSYDSIPYKQMWVDDGHWLPLVLTGQFFTARFHLDKPATADYDGKILKYDVDVVDELPSEQ